MDEFPEFVGESESEMPPHIAAIVGQVFGRDEKPDTRELEWANVMTLAYGEGVLFPENIEVAKKEIRQLLNDGYSLMQLYRVKEGVVYWQGARLKKPEGE